jgi:hypothetical protein
LVFSTSFASRTPEVTPSFYWGSSCSMFSYLCGVLLTIVWRKKSIKTWKFDEKRLITPKWVMEFTSKLQGR